MGSCFCLNCCKESCTSNCLDMAIMVLAGFSAAFNIFVLSYTEWEIAAKWVIAAYVGNVLCSVLIFLFIIIFIRSYRNNETIFTENHKKAETYLTWCIVASVCGICLSLLGIVFLETYILGDKKEKERSGQCEIDENDPDCTITYESGEKTEGFAPAVIFWLFVSLVICLCNDKYLVSEKKNSYYEVKQNPVNVVPVPVPVPVPVSNPVVYVQPQPQPQPRIEVNVVREERNIYVINPECDSKDIIRT